MSIGKLFSSEEEFFKSVDDGTKLVQTDMAAPDEKDRETLKSLLAVFIVATIKMDPEGFKDPDLPNKLGAIKAALIASYHLGKNTLHPKKDE